MENSTTKADAAATVTTSSSFATCTAIQLATSMLMLFPTFITSDILFIIFSFFPQGSVKKADFRGKVENWKTWVVVVVVVSSCSCSS